jgi:hypothetical protein
MMTTAPESYGGKPLPSEYRGDMLAIYRSSRHLLDLINDVLDLSQIEAGRMVIHKERVILVDVIREAADIVRGLAEARRLQLIVDEPPAALVIELDRVRTRQVLLNLLTNAMRYTEQGWVRIDTEIAGDAVTIRVADSGRGIAPDKLQRAFEAFDRLDEEDLTHGSGLGLAVSKKFVELHEGRMWIASTPGQGTCVGFTLPLPSQTERLPLGALRLSAMTAPDRVRPSVLVIHDDLRTVALLRVTSRGMTSYSPRTLHRCRRAWRSRRRMPSSSSRARVRGGATWWRRPVKTSPSWWRRCPAHIMPAPCSARRTFCPSR